MTRLLANHGRNAGVYGCLFLLKIVPQEEADFHLQPQEAFSLFLRATARDLEKPMGIPKSQIREIIPILK